MIPLPVHSQTNCPNSAGFSFHLCPTQDPGFGIRYQAVDSWLGFLMLCDFKYAQALSAAQFCFPQKRDNNTYFAGML